MDQYSDKESMLVENRDSSAHLRTSTVLRTVNLEYKRTQGTYLIGNSSPEGGSSTELDCLTRASIKCDNRNDEFIYDLYSISTKT